VLDHFNAIDGRTWGQRFWENMEHYATGGPAFIMIGGEAEASPGWLNYGQWYKWAEENGAAMFLLEHRYYGQSHPTEDMSTENMRYLSSRQGLEDLGHFMTAINSKHNLTGSWITFGGSYPGSLSAWMSLRFPHLVAGSVSSSGPLYAKLDYYEYLEVVADALDTTGPGCNPAMTEALSAVETMVADQDTWQDLSTLFRLCGPLDGSNPMDVMSFMELLIDNLAGIVQYNGHYEEDIFSICAIMTDETIGDPIARLATVNDIMLGSEEDACLDNTYASFLAQLSDTTWSAGGVGWRQWIWQTCTEFGWYQTTNQESGVYGHTLPLNFFEQWCQDAFGDMFTHEMLEKSIAASNIEYGGYEPSVNNVVFVHGSIDPWHAMGVLEDLHEGAPSIYITGTSHCADMYADAASDPEELTAARIRIGGLVKGWVENARK
jgi:pimeloyl-ACP methyl ester carboxylesterase